MIMKTIPLLCCLLLTSPAHAKFTRPIAVPVERLEKKAEGYLKEHPDDASAWYVLGRIHYLAFVLNSEALNGSDGNAGAAPSLHHIQNQGLREIRELEARQRAAKQLGMDPALIPGRGSAAVISNEQMQAFQQLTAKISEELEVAGWKPDGIKPEAAARHVSEALRCFDKAIALQADDGLFLLGRASLLDQYMEPSRQQILGSIENKPKPVSEEEIIAAYLKAYDASKAKDEAAKYLPILGLNALVSYEAGQAYLKIAPKGERAGEIAKHLAKLKALPRGAVTPIIAAPARSIRQLFDGDHAEFDITGLGWTANYPWPGNRAAFLVWDPDLTGRITNGRQLFGFYTWGIFWRDGYQALSMLDDNDDGVLSGGELAGIFLWTDRNGNGASEPDEIASASESRVKSIRVHAYFNEGIHPMCPDGVEFYDHRPWTTWDWMAEPLRMDRWNP